MAEQGTSIPIPPTIIVDVELLEPDPDNPNEEDAETFTELVENIRQHGFIEPIVAWRPEGYGDRLRIVGGEHRWRAAQFLDLPQVPVVVLPVESLEEASILLIRMNAIRGKLNPFKFTKMFNALRKQYDPDELRRRMGLVNDRAFKQLYRDVRATLPPEVKKKLDATRREIHDVYDLANVVRGALAEFGETLAHSYAVLEYGGKRHYVIRLSERAFKNVERMAGECSQNGTDINDTLVELWERD